MAFDNILHNGTIKKFIAAQPKAEGVYEALDELYENTKAIHGVHMNAQYLIIDRLCFDIMNTSDVVWVHHQQQQMRLYGVVPTGNVNHVIIRTRDGKDHAVAVATAKGAKDLINRLFPLLPNAVFGYNQQILGAWRDGQNDGYQTLSLLGRLQHEALRA